MIKKLLCIPAAILCCIMALTVGAYAAAVNKIELKASGSEAKITIDFPQAAAEEIASMQISLNVKVNSDKAEIEFIPDDGLSSKIAESRYHSDTGVLNIYLAGSEPLFVGSAPLSVGTVKISGSAVSATVSIAEGSVKFVRGGELIKGEELTDTYGEITYPEYVTVTTEKPVNPSSGSSWHTHKYGDWTVTVSADCQKEGERTRTCRTCGRKDTEAIPRTAHNYIQLEYRESDGTTAGYTDYICVYCSETKREFDIVLGDVDRNGRVNAIDAAVILRATVNKTDLEPMLADYNKDGNINALDAAAILKWVVGL
ncbi:MAG: hypothetical protein K2O14_10790 [Oscillospiraceae bacterium]|nr:hypothetical protein [Oscillospiraceae bacterium]